MTRARRLGLVALAAVLAACSSGATVATTTTQPIVALAVAQTGAEPFGTHLSSHANDVVRNEEPLAFDTANLDTAAMFNPADPTVLTVTLTGWYWVGVDVTTLGTYYKGPDNRNVQIAVMRNWTPGATQLNHYIAYARHQNRDGASAAGNSLLQLVPLVAGDRLQVVLIGPTAGGLLVESNPSDGLPGGFPTDMGPGTMSPHFYVVAA